MKFTAKFIADEKKILDKIVQNNLSYFPNKVLRALDFYWMTKVLHLRLICFNCMWQKVLSIFYQHVNSYKNEYPGVRSKMY